MQLLYLPLSHRQTKLKETDPDQLFGRFKIQCVGDSLPDFCAQYFRHVQLFTQPHIATSLLRWVQKLGRCSRQPFYINHPEIR